MTKDEQVDQCLKKLKKLEEKTETDEFSSWDAHEKIAHGQEIQQLRWSLQMAGQ